VSLCNKNWFFVTKYKRDAFTKKIPDDRSPIFASVCTDFELELNHPITRNKLSFGDLWSPSCSAKSCGGAPISVIYMYINQPPAPHSIERQRKEGCAFRAYILALNGEVLRANLINPP
jgi:putative transposase